MKIEFRPSGMPCKFGQDDGDSMLWAGLLTAVGVDCSNPIAHCQSYNGRLWRSPERVQKDIQNSFSRDMAIGFLLGAVNNPKLSEALYSWIEYLNKEKQLCPDSTDSRHIITPQIWWAIYLVSSSPKVPWIYRKTAWMLPIVNMVLSRFSPLGYAMHLNACIMLLLFKLGLHKPWHARFLWLRQPNNPFFRWLAGKNLSIPPQMQGNGRQWAWERDTNEKAWQNSCGHDYVFINALRKL